MPDWLTNTIDWLNDNDGAVLALLTFVYVVTTVILVAITRAGTRVAQKSLEASERFERERSRPYVIANLINRPLGTVQIRVENVGATAAYDIEIHTDPVIRILQGGQGVVPPQETSQPHPFIERGIAFMPPKHVEENVIALKYERYRSEYGDSQFTGTVKYKDKGGQVFEDPLIIDLAGKEGTLFMPEYSVGKELHEIRELLRKKLG
jgi:hypothetical protein